MEVIVFMVVVSWIIRIILDIVAVGLVVVVLLQKGKEANLGALAGGGDSFAAKGKAKGKDAMLEKLTKIGMISFMVLAILLAIITKFFL